jgi:putative addiction module component (TIGR02574 family)
MIRRVDVDVNVKEEACQGKRPHTDCGSDARLCRMNSRVDHLLDEALELPTEERSALVVALLDSLDGKPDASISEAWREELRTRRNALHAGTVKAVPWADVKARLNLL